jgi:glycerol-1-phosphatase
VPELELDGLLVDLDGCVWIGGEPLPGAVRALQRISDHGIEVAFITNDPASTRALHATRLTELGLPTPPERVITAAWALARTVAREHPDATTYVLGPAAMRDELSEAGVAVLPPGAPAEAAARADVVAVGTSSHLGFPELTVAVRAVLAGARLYTANRDPWFPMPDGPWPSSGAFAAFVEAATGASAIAIGKPEPALYDAACQQLGNAERIGAVGDRRDADIAGGERAGLVTVLVGDGHGAGPDPDHHLAGLRDLPALLGLPSAPEPLR